MNDPLSIEIRRLGPGDGDVVAALATYPRLQEETELLADERTFILVAFEGVEPVGFVLGHELLRRHGDRSNLLVYEVDVAESHRRRGIAAALMRELAALARARGSREAFVLTEPDNDAANGLYGSLGGRREEVVMWDFDYEES